MTKARPGISSWAGGPVAAGSVKHSVPLDLNYKTGRLTGTEDGEFQDTLRTKALEQQHWLIREQWAQGWAGHWGWEIRWWAGGPGTGLWIPRGSDPILCLGFRRNGDLVGYTNDKVGC